MAKKSPMSKVTDVTDIAESATIALPKPVVKLNPDMQQVHEHLLTEGFRPTLDSDGSIGFKCEGWKIYVDAYDGQLGFRMYSCVYSELDISDRTYAITTANTISASRRCVKAMVTDTNTVWITYETFCADVPEYTRTLSRAAEYVISACREYREEFRRVSLPMTIN